MAIENLVAETAGLDREIRKRALFVTTAKGELNSPCTVAAE
jgi:hypothetical protein